MIFSESQLLVADNSGAKRVKCIKVLKSSKSSGGKPMNIVILSVRKVKKSKNILKGSVHRGIIVRLKKTIQRDNGSTIKFSTNSVILLDQKNVPIGSRIFGPLYREVKFENYPKILSLAKILL